MSFESDEAFGKEFSMQVATMSLAMTKRLKECEEPSTRLAIVLQADKEIHKSRLGS